MPGVGERPVITQTDARCCSLAVDLRNCCDLADYLWRISPYPTTCRNAHRSNQSNALKLRGGATNQCAGAADAKRTVKRAPRPASALGSKLISPL